MTLVSFHAHPDDESIGTGGLLAAAADAGHRVVLVFGTRGELGTPVPGVLRDDEQLTLRRTAETYESARALGVARVEFLGFTDSGMMGEPTNDAPWSFWQAEVEHAASRLAVILGEEQPEVLTVYDDIGGYGHPDHIQVHRVGIRAAEIAGTPVVVQGTINKDHIARAMAMASDFGVEIDIDGDGEPDPAPFGKAESEITHQVDVTAVVHRKRASMLAHASQIGPDHFMLAMPDDAFSYVFGTEWFIVDPESVAAAPVDGIFAGFFSALRPQM